MESNVKILLVDDDPLVLKMYRDSLFREGLTVATAQDGMEALQALRADRPQVVVLDLLMPRFSGVDVLKFIRSEQTMADLPVIIFSNAFMNDMANAANELGVQGALMKARCTPSELAGAIRDVVGGRTSNNEACAQAEVALGATPQAGPASASASAGSIPATLPPDARSAAELRAKARTDFLQTGPAEMTALRSLSEEFDAATDPKERGQRLETFCRKAHFVSAAASLAECHQIAWLASGLEAMLFELNEKPAFLSSSVRHTTASTLNLLGALFKRSATLSKGPPSLPPPAHALVVDDDPISNRVIIAALHRAQVQGRSTENPREVVPLLEKKKFDLILLDIEMPGMDGFQVCKRVRAVPGYAKTPVIFVTSHDDFDNRASAMSGGNDLISKPVFPIELALKAVTQMLSAQMG